MRKKTYGFGAAVAALLLVGGGCVATQTTDMKIDTGMPAVEMEADTSIDATVDSIIMDIDAELSEQTTAEADADSVDADAAELTAYGEASYDIE